MIHSPYAEHMKPLLADVLAAIGLDVTYHKAQGNHLYYYQQQQEIAVLDLLGGYGSLIFGHHHPELVAEMQHLLTSQVPVHAQFSLRGRAGELAAKLNHLIMKEIGDEQPYITTLSNTGAEAVEAAIKHAELSRILRLSDLLDKITLNIEKVRNALRRGEATVSADFYEHTSIREQQFDVQGFDQLIVGLINYNSKQLFKRPVFIALEKAFHGKLAGSVQLTYNKNFRRPFQYFGLKSRFVPLNDVEALEQIRQEEQLELFDLAIDAGKVTLVRRQLPIFAAFLLEPVQGEGGIHEVSREFGLAVRRFCNQQEIPLIIDEIQSGMGRCGALLASSQINLKGDYYCLSKSLGGGITKISAMLVRADHYQKSFGLIHSSTFAEDDLSAGIALKVLSMLEHNDGAAYRQAIERGQTLYDELRQLQERYPTVIKDVRGRGLFIGLEFYSQKNAASQVIRAAAYSDSLGYFISGYLLKAEKIRIAPTGSAPNVLRMEPSIYITNDEIRFLIQALDRVCLMLKQQDALPLVHCLCDNGQPLLRTAMADFRQHETYQPAPQQSSRPVRKVAFINHLISPEWLRQVDPSLAALSDAELREFVLKMHPGKKSAPYPPVRIQSRLGPVVEFILYPLCAISEQMGNWLASGDLSEIRDDITERLEAAVADGCEIAGLGMYTSIVTNNCTALAIPELALTSGNALTVAISLQAMDKAAKESGLNWRESVIAIIGAAGNIASTYACMLAERCPHIILIGSGRDGSLQRVRKTLYALYESCWQLILQGGNLTGIPAKLRHEPIIHEWLEQGAPEKDLGKLLHQRLVSHHGTDPYVTLSQDPADACRAHAVLCAANAPEPFLERHHFAPQALVCDVAVPANVPSSVAGSEGLTYLQGGIVATPFGESLHPGARAFLGEGQVFACMAESIILGLSGYNQHYSYGAISRQQVNEIAALAEIHGFRLADFKRGSSL